MGEQLVVDHHHLVIVTRDDPDIVREIAVNDLGGQGRAAEFEADFLRAQRQIDGFASVVEQPPRLIDGLARHDDAGRSSRTLWRDHFGQRQTVPIGGHGAQLGHATLDHGVEVETVQIIAGLFGRDGEFGLVDQPDQVGHIDTDAGR